LEEQIRVLEIVLFKYFLRSEVGFAIRDIDDPELQLETKKNIDGIQCPSHTLTDTWVYDGVE
jgi:hypothetical protein